MDPTGKSFLKLLFNEEETISVSNSQFAYEAVPLETVLCGKVTLISPNPNVRTRTVDSSSLVLVALNPIKGRRNDNNCYRFRNFLIEMDTFTRDKQIGYIKKLGMPYSAMVWSGSRSTHTLISLNKDLPDQKTYRFIYKWILNIASLSDQQLGNPQRGIRIPGNIRPETGKLQELIDIKGRTSIKDLMKWLSKYQHLKPKPPEVKAKKERVEGKDDYSRLSVWCRVMMKSGVVFNGSRNATWYAVAVDFAKAGFDEDRATEIILSKFTEEHDFKEKELLATIRSGFKRVEDESQ